MLAATEYLVQGYVAKPKSNNPPPEKYELTVIIMIFKQRILFCRGKPRHIASALFTGRSLVGPPGEARHYALSPTLKMPGYNHPKMIDISMALFDYL
jgi:hypothetical protein